MLQRLFWKLIPKDQRNFLLGRLSAVDRQVVNRSMSAHVRLPPQFDLNGCLFIHVPKCAGSTRVTTSGWAMPEVYPHALAVPAWARTAIKHP